MSKVLQNALLEHSAIFSTFIKIPFVFKICVLSISEWPLKTGVMYNIDKNKMGFNSETVRAIENP